MGKMRPIRKRSFLVLELVIALFLIVTCLFPLLRPNIELFKRQQIRSANWKAYTLDRKVLIKVKEQLLEAKFSFEQLKSGVEIDDCQISVAKKTERESVHKEGLLLKVETPYRTHFVFVERGI